MVETMEVLDAIADAIMARRPREKDEKKLRDSALMAFRHAHCLLLGLELNLRDGATIRDALRAM